MQDRVGQSGANPLLKLPQTPQPEGLNDELRLWTAEATSTQPLAASNNLSWPYGGIYFVWVSDLGHPGNHGNVFVGRCRRLRMPGAVIAKLAAVAASASQALTAAP